MHFKLVSLKLKKKSGGFGIMAVFVLLVLLLTTCKNFNVVSFQQTSIDLLLFFFCGLRKSFGKPYHFYLSDN